jgi:predicted Zn-dependent peptidase
LASLDTVYSYDLERRVISHTLKNGLKVLMIERHLSPTVSFYIRHRVGAIDEDEGKTGAAHLLEHMMFKGTKSIGAKNYIEELKILRQIAEVGNRIDLETMKGERADKNRIELLNNQIKDLQRKHKEFFIENEIDRLYTENGADDVNASTGYDLTTYHVSLPSNKIELWARIEADRMTNPVFREFYSERSVVMEERRQRVESDPDGLLYESFLASAYIAHPYRRPILGWPSDIRFLSLEYIEAFFKRHYAPNNTVIAIVGDIDPEKTLNLINKYFGSLPRGKFNPTPATEEPLQQGERRINVTSDANPQIIIGYHKPTLPSFDDYVFDLIECILSKGRTSRFYQALVEGKAIAKSINASNGIPGAKDPNLFVIFAKPRHPYTSPDLELSIYEEIKKLQVIKIPQRELQRAKNQITADFIRNLDSNLGFANMLSYFEILAGDYRYITEHIKIIEKITPEDIMRVANKYLISENRTIANFVKKN